MTRICTLLILVVVSLLFHQAANADALVGVGTIAVFVPERGATMDVTVWYPAVAIGQPILVGENALFQGVPAQRDAPAAAGSAPLVLLSQGGLRSGPNIGAWMASRLAAHGFVVAMLRQPDPHSQAAQDVLHEIWLRPADISGTLTAINKDSVLSRMIDPDRVGLLGLQIGGTAALALAGARLDPDSFARACDQGGTEVDCAWFAKVGLDLRTVDAVRLARSHLDQRIKAVVVIDPELTANFTQASLARISIPIHIINLGSPGVMWPGLDASGLVRLIPMVHYDSVPDANQFSIFPECKKQAPAIMRAEGEEPFCDDFGGRSRTEVHDHLAATVDASFRRSLSR